MNTREILTRLKIGLSLLIGFIAGKLAAAWSEPHSSEFFSAGFLAGAIATQGVFRLIALSWQNRRAS